MFKKKKDEIKVIKVQHSKRTITETSEISNFGGYSSREKTDTKEVSKVDITSVLYTRNGVLSVREFNGKWNLTDIRGWEDIEE